MSAVSVAQRARDACLELIAPTRCAGCDYPGHLLCRTCQERLARIDCRWSCKKCGAPYGHLICTECLEEEWHFSHNYSLAEFDAIASRMVVLHKDHGERRLAQIIGNLLVRGVRESEAALGEVVTWIPSTVQAYRRRGFDHGFEIARVFAGELNLPLAQGLSRTQVRDQRMLGREERAQNMHGSFSVGKGIAKMRGKSVVIIDDVFTTGATLNEASRVLRGSGVREVNAATLARVW